MGIRIIISYANSFPSGGMISIGAFYRDEFIPVYFVVYLRGVVYNEKYLCISSFFCFNHGGA